MAQPEDIKNIQKKQPPSFNRSHGKDSWKGNNPTKGDLLTMLTKSY